MGTQGEEAFTPTDADELGLEEPEADVLDQRREVGDPLVEVEQDVAIPVEAPEPDTLEQHHVVRLPDDEDSAS
ncbi:MAG TPA: hypothetical protein VIL34_14640 [Actinopolymorphaceae bacterium]|jgi:hypothetical protein